MCWVRICNPFKLWKKQHFFDNNRQGAMGLKTCSLGKNFLHVSFNQLSPSVPFLWSLKEGLFMFSGCYDWGHWAVMV